MTYKKTEFTSLKSKTVSTIDYFVQYKDGTMGAVAFYFMSNEIAYAYIHFCEVIKRLDHLVEVKFSEAHGMFNISEFDDKLIYVKIGNREILSRRPNKNEKT